MKALLEHTVEEKFMEPSVMSLIAFLNKPDEILDYIEHYKNH